MGLSFTHLLVLLIILLLFFGPNRLPSLGKSLGEAIRGFKSGLEGAGTPPAKETRTEQISANSQQSTTQTAKEHAEKI